MKYPNYSDAQIEKRYTDAREIYDDFGINTDTVLRKLDKIRISMHCWQGDDVGGFECREDKTLTGGILATGSKPGKARNADELRQDAEKAFSLIPGRHRFNLHAIYLETGGRFVDRNEIEPEHFVRWVDWAKSLKIKLDFNPTFFSHPKSASGFTLSSPDKAIRKFWIEHAKRCRFIAEYFSKELNSVVINNTWIPDGAKDIPADRWNPREILIDSLDEIFRKKYGQSFKNYLCSYRINEACRQLLYTNKQIGRIAEDVGYKDVDYFLCKFIELKGCTPSHFRKSKTEKPHSEFPGK